MVVTRSGPGGAAGGEASPARGGRAARLTTLSRAARSSLRNSLRRTWVDIAPLVGLSLPLYGCSAALQLAFSCSLLAGLPWLARLGLAGLALRCGAERWDRSRNFLLLLQLLDGLEIAGEVAASDKQAGEVDQGDN